MSDLDILRRLRAIEERLGRIEVLETPGGTTWTPTFTGSGGGGSFTYALQSGAYIVAGGIFFGWWYLSINTFTSAPAGNLQISGLPFAANAAAPGGGGIITDTDATLSVAAYLLINAGASILLPLQSNGASVAASTLAAGSVLHGVVIYRV